MRNGAEFAPGLGPGTGNGSPPRYKPWPMRAPLTTLFLRAMDELRLHPVAPVSIHSFPGHGGVTAVQLLSESHLTAHTFPESGYAAFNLYCCRPRPDWPWERRLSEVLGATRVEVRRIARPGRLP